MYTVVTGAFGFIGSNIVKALNDRGVRNIVAVDDLTESEKFRNVVDCDIFDYVDRKDFLQKIRAGEYDGKIERIFHEGACSDTMETDGKYMMDTNYQYSLTLLDFCTKENIPYIYASSAAVYGGGKVFSELREFEAPLNVYGYSKFLFDQIVRDRLPKATSQIVGLRYFNVYGPREAHKGRMASVAFHHYNQYKKDGKVRVFEGSDGYGNGEQCRDFVYVEDIANVNLFFLDNPGKSGIFNVGTGRSQPFNDIAVSIINSTRALEGKPSSTLDELISEGVIEYISFPDSLKGKYQSFTQADISALRHAGYTNEFATVERGVEKYVEYLSKLKST